MPAEKLMTISEVMALCQAGLTPVWRPAPKPKLRIYVPPKPARKRRPKS
ncbi:MAG: hypothetical protein ACJ8FY_09745 [Gemmataceae bacterium]